MVIEKTVHGKDAMKRKTASVIDKGYGLAIPQEHWLMDVGNSVFPRNTGSPGTAFLAESGAKRPQPHIKINDCDH